MIFHICLTFQISSATPFPSRSLQLTITGMDRDHSQSWENVHLCLCELQNQSPRTHEKRSDNIFQSASVCLFMDSCFAELTEWGRTVMVAVGFETDSSLKGVLWRWRKKGKRNKDWVGQSGKNESSWETGQTSLLRKQENVGQMFT